jgi:glutathione synthase/RimK-type ligase-like ATP-grasp enzyme
MNPNLRCLVKACCNLEIPYETYHESNNVVLVAKKHFFVNWAVPLISYSLGRLCTDKEYSYTLLRDSLAMPSTIGFLDPKVETIHQNYVQHLHIRDMVCSAQDAMPLPVIVKRNSGSHGSHVFLCHTWEAVEAAITKVFDRNSSEYDYVALLQKYIPTVKETRVVLVDGKVSFAYQKDVSGASFCGNLSPLHWEGARGILCTVGEEKKLQDFLAPLFIRLPCLRYVGIDVLEDAEGKLWLLEINGSPGYRVFIRDNGTERVVKMYEEVLALLECA